jgi:hypothetical protein
MTELSGKDFNEEETKQIGKQIGINWETSSFDVDQFRRGFAVELEHGIHDPETDVSGNDPVITGKITWAHLKEFPDYYDRLEKMEEEVKVYWENKAD